MEKNNYYAWLELPVEKFEEDTVKLSECLEKHILTWQSSKTLKIQERAAIYAKDMREAIADSVRWKQLYMEYRSSVNTKILESLKYIGKQEVPKEDIALIAESQKVSEAYVEQVAKEKGYKISSEESSSDKQRQGITIKNLEPVVTIKNQLETIQKQIEGLGFADIAELVNDQIDGSLSLESSSKEEFSKNLTEIKKKWERKSTTNNEISQKKSYYNKICVGLITFWKKNEIADYLNFINWRNVSQRLNSMFSDLTKLKLDSLQDDAFNRRVDEIYSLLGRGFKRDDAKSILAAFCDEKKIAYPKPLPKIASCPYCKTFFEKTEPVQAKCPTCGKSLMVKCPKCGKEKNMIADSICDGMDLLRFPVLEDNLESARIHYSRLSLIRTKSILADIAAEWKGFPGAEELQKKCAETERQYGNDLRAIEQLVEKRELHKAKEICDKFLQDFPAARFRFEGIYNSLEEVKELLKKYQAEKDQSRRKNYLREMLNIVVDDPMVNTEMPDIKAVEGLTTRVNYDAGTIILSWKSQNEVNSVDYHIIRKRLGKITNSEDGEEIGRIRDMFFSDANVQEGEVYYYAVYASIGTIKGALVAASAPVILLLDVEMNITPKNQAIDVTWPEQQETVKAFYSETKISAYGQGQEVPNVTKRGFYLEHLSNDKTYYIACFKVSSFDGKDFRSAGSFGMATPMEEIVEPEVTKSMGSMAGEYIITLVNPQNGLTFQLYYGSGTIATVPLKRNVDIALIQEKLKKLDCVFLGDGKYSVTISGQNEMMVYPVYSKGRAAIVGNPLNLKYIKPIRIKESIVTGNALNLVIESWPDGADALLVCYNDDAFPEDRNDAQRKIAISKGEYDKKPLLEIPELKNIHYYIAIFARKTGEYVPVCNYEFQNKKKVRIEYSFSRGVLGRINLTIKNTSNSRPELYLVVTGSRIPLSKTDGTLVATYPAVHSEKEEEKITISGFTPTAGCHGKLFTDDRSYELVLVGSSQLK